MTMRVLVLGGTGTIGRAVVAEHLARSHDVVAVVRPGRSVAGAKCRPADLFDPASLARDGFSGERFDAVISCIASRTGVPKDAWAVDCGANSVALRVAGDTGTGHFQMLSALCVQKPLRAFQQAKLAFERELSSSGMGHSIIRPTAFFKSLSGQVARVQTGKPFLVFGDGRLTATKPISDRDLARFMCDVLEDPAQHGHVLPVGGPGPAETPRDQAGHLFKLLGRDPHIRQVPPTILKLIGGTLGLGGVVSQKLFEKAELARIGHYYATESMLVWDSANGRYDAGATPEFGSDRLEDYFEQVIRGDAIVERGDHAMF